MKIFQKFICILGYVSFVIFIAIFLLFNYEILKNREDTLSKDDLKYIYYMGFDKKRIKRVIHSYQSPISFTGDHIDLVEIEMDDINGSELLEQKDYFQKRRWYRVDEAKGIISDAIDFTIMGYYSYAPWFLTKKDLKRGDFLIYVRSIYYMDGQVNGAVVLYADPATNRLFYIDSQI